ncbi:hypothetical protein VPHK469_0119 [Vibrio phage K469]
MSDFKLPVGFQQMPRLVYNIMVKAVIHKCHLDVHDRTFCFVVEGSEYYTRLCEYLHNVFTTVGLTSVKAVDQGKGYYFLKLDNGCTFRVYDDNHFNTDMLRGLGASFMFGRTMTDEERSCLVPVVVSTKTSFMLEVI